MQLLANLPWSELVPSAPIELNCTRMYSLWPNRPLAVAVCDDTSDGSGGAYSGFHVAAVSASSRDFSCASPARMP